MQLLSLKNTLQRGARSTWQCLAPSLLIPVGCLGSGLRIGMRRAPPAGTPKPPPATGPLPPARFPSVERNTTPALPFPWCLQAWPACPRRWLQGLIF